MGTEASAKIGTVPLTKAQVAAMAKFKKRRAIEAPLPVFSQEDAWATLEKRVHTSFGIDANEFLRKWDAGEYADADTFDVSRAAMLIPFVR